jgi:hypothetical protein
MNEVGSSTRDDGVKTTHNMGYAILEGDRIATISLARFRE